MLIGADGAPRLIKAVEQCWCAAARERERDAKHRLQVLVLELDRAGYTAAEKCLADDLDALVVHLRYRHRRR
jgi:hypothetical protein